MNQWGKESEMAINDALKRAVAHGGVPRRWMNWT